MTIHKHFLIFGFVLAGLSMNRVITPLNAEEMRGIWYRPVANRDTLISDIRSLGEAGFNAIFIETYYHSYTIYPSQIADQRPEFTGWDPLQTALDVASDYNLQIHAWIEVYYAYNPAYLDGSNGPLLAKHPEWLLISQNPYDHTAENGKLYINPALPEVRSYICDLVRELVTTYALAGINLDYIRYPVDNGQKAFGFDDFSLGQFSRTSGFSTSDIQRRNAKVWQAFTRWRCDQVTMLVHDLREILNQSSSQVQLSAAVFADYRSDPTRGTKCQDWQSWVQGDLLDFLTPMCYGLTSVQRKAEIRETLKYSKIPVMAGIAINHIDTPRELHRYYQEVRNHPIQGIVWFAYNWRKPFFLPTLKESIYSPRPTH